MTAYISQVAMGCSGAAEVLLLLTGPSFTVAAFAVPLLLCVDCSIMVLDTLVWIATLLWYLVPQTYAGKRRFENTRQAITRLQAEARHLLDGWCDSIAYSMTLLAWRCEEAIASSIPCGLGYYAFPTAAFMLEEDVKLENKPRKQSYFVGKQEDDDEEVVWQWWEATSESIERRLAECFAGGEALGTSMPTSYTTGHCGHMWVVCTPLTTQDLCGSRLCYSIGGAGECERYSRR